MNRPTETPIEIDNPKQILEQNNNLKTDAIQESHPRLEAIRNLQESNKAEN